MSVGLDFVLAIDQTGREYFDFIYTGLMENFVGLYKQILIMFLALISVGMIMGKFGQYTPLIVQTIVGILFTYGLFIETSIYKEWLYMPIYETAVGLGGWIVQEAGYSYGGSAEGYRAMFSVLDSSMVRIFDFIINLEGRVDEESWFGLSNLAATLLVVAFFLVYGLLYAIFTALIVVAAAAVHILAIVGGPVGLLAGFPAARGIFYSWLRQLVTYALYPVFAGLILGFFLGTIEASTADLAQLDPSEGVFNALTGRALLAGVLAGFLLLQIPSFAGALAGGQGASVPGAGIASAAGSGLGSAAGRGAGAAAGKAGGAAASGAGGAASGIKSGASAIMNRIKR